jgi:hypothetical protein
MHGLTEALPAVENKYIKETITRIRIAVRIISSKDNFNCIFLYLKRKRVISAISEIRISKIKVTFNNTGNKLPGTDSSVFTGKRLINSMPESFVKENKFPVNDRNENKEIKKR